MVVAEFFDWIESIWGKQGQVQSAVQTMPSFTTIEALDNYYGKLPDAVKNDAAVKTAYEARKNVVGDKHTVLSDPVKNLVLSLLDKWQDKVKQYDMTDPSKAKDTLAGLTANILEISAGAFALELGMGAIPFTQEGPVSQAKISEIMAWLGFGAVVTAVAHDPVKIGVLRPYQDSLEATFRNRRPGDIALFQAYRTRELSPVKIDDLSKLDDKEMDRIEADNETVYMREIAKWGYSEWFANALARSATRTLGFSNLVQLARAGIYDRGLYIYSLWGEGLDRVMMKEALNALQLMRDREMYSGFRSMIEPSYVEGDLEERDLIDYWTKVGVPGDVQNWVLPRLRRRRQANIEKGTIGRVAKEKDLTQSQISTAYVDGLITREKAKDDIIRLGYDASETEILLSIADARKKTPSAAKLKRLTLTDYEKAYKNKLISLDAVLQRMEGEYDPRDITLERRLLEIGKA